MIAQNGSDPTARCKAHAVPAQKEENTSSVSPKPASENGEPSPRSSATLPA